jgi:hypothetical protein
MMGGFGGADPAWLGNEYQALHPETTYRNFGKSDGPQPPKRKPIRNLIRRILGRDEKQDQ